MHRIAGNKHEITGLDSPGFVANSEPAFAFQDKDELLVIRLDVDDIFTFFENVDVAREVLAVTQERSLDGICSSCRVRRETTNGIPNSKEVQ
jgi:hypothetical protein